MTSEEIYAADKFLEFVDNIKNKQNFSFIRYGDGEWALMLKKNPVYKKAGMKWGPSILQTGEWMLNHIKQNPGYIIGIQPLALRHWSDEILEIVKDYKNLANSDTFHKNSIKNNLNLLFDELKDRHVILVGPAYLRFNLFEYDHIVTPEGSAWDRIEILKTRINKSIKPDSVVLYSCSIAAKLMIRDLYLKHRENITQIDMGSVFDPYAGVDSRSYHSDIIKRLDIPTVKKVIHK